MVLLLPPVAKYGNRARSGPMRKPAETSRDREDRNATSGSIFVYGPIGPRGLSETTPELTARLARESLESDLESLPGLAARLTSAMLDRLEAYVALLLEANQHINLTRVIDPVAIGRQHLLDSLVALPELDNATPSHAVDIGSGGGLPAIPIAIARPDVSWVLLESVGKKARALASFVEELRLPATHVVAERAEVLGRDPRHRELAGLVTARAVAALPVLAELAMPLLVPGGLLVAWKGPLTATDGELQRGRRALAALGGGSLELLPAGAPQLGGHTLIRVQKQRTTPARYPRRPGEPARRPLG
jgi:16S rRNA (guanine527-N7)-methyltransferase